jgi:hypothetical protein
MRTDSRVFFLKVVRTDRVSASHTTRLPGRLDVLDYSLFLTEIRLVCSMQDLIVIKFGRWLSFFTLRGQQNLLRLVEVSALRLHLDGAAELAIDAGVGAYLGRNVVDAHTPTQAP